MKKLTLLFIFIILVGKYSSQNGFCLTSLQDPPFSTMQGLCMAKADFNNDGKIDICTESIQSFSASVNFGVAFILSSSNYTNFTLAVLNSTTPLVSLCTNDFNTDGNSDVAAICANSNKLFVLLGSGTGSFALNTYTLNEIPTVLVTADFNNDSKPDLALANTASNSISILLGTGTGNFPAALNYTLSAQPNLLISGDFNNNNASDLFVVTNGPAYFLKGGGNGTFTVTPSFSISATDVISVDLNSDAKLDLLYTDAVNDKIVVLKGNANFTFNAAVNYSIPGVGGSQLLGRIAYGDFNNDSKIDLLTAYSTYSVCILPGSGTGLFLAPLAYSINISGNNNVSNFIVADLNNDSKVDIIVAAHSMTMPFVDFKLLLNCNTVDVKLKEIAGEEQFIVAYPNPAQDFLNLKFALKSYDKFISATTFNIAGQMLSEQELNFHDNQVSIKTEDLQNGVYFLRLNAVNFSPVRKRFVISR